MSRKPRRTESQLAKAHSSIYSPGESNRNRARHWQARLEHHIFNELQALLNDEVADPSVQGVTLLAVHLSPDLAFARVAYAMQAALRDEQHVGPSSAAALGRATGFLKVRLAQQLQLKRTPELQFTFVGVTQAKGGTSCLE
jgi:ribosome-binding factor A